MKCIISVQYQNRFADADREAVVFCVHTEPGALLMLLRLWLKHSKIYNDAESKD